MVRTESYSELFSFYSIYIVYEQPWISVYNLLKSTNFKRLIWRLTLDTLLVMVNSTLVRFTDSVNMKTVITLLTHRCFQLPSERKFVCQLFIATLYSTVVVWRWYRFFCCAGCGKNEVKNFTTPRHPSSWTWPARSSSGHHTSLPHHAAPPLLLDLTGPILVLTSHILKWTFLTLYTTLFVFNQWSVVISGPGPDITHRYMAWHKSSSFYYKGLPCSVTEKVFSQINKYI